MRRRTTYTVRGLAALPLVATVFGAIFVSLAASLAVPALAIVAILVLLGVIPSPF